MQIVERAIERSVSHNEIVTIDVGPSGLVCGGDGVRGESVCAELALECDDDVVNGPVHEYWGTTDDDDEWRVHVQIPQPDRCDACGRKYCECAS